MAYRPHSLLSARLRQHGMLFVAEGVIIVLLGCVPLMERLVGRIIDANSIVFTAAMFLLSSLLGFLFLLLGFVGLVKTVAMWPARGSWYSMISALLAISIFPIILEQTLSFSNIQKFLTYLFAAFFLVEGMAMITYALDQRRERAQRWMLLGASGAGYLLVGIMFPVIQLGMLSDNFFPNFFLMPVALLIGGATMITVALEVSGGSEHVARA